MSQNPPSKVLLAVSGASGAIYATTTLRLLLQAGVKVDLIYSPAAVRVLKEEMDILLSNDPSVLIPTGQDRTSVQMHDHADIGAAPASGSSLAPVMIIAPCSLSTLAGIANGLASNLIERAAQVALKEGKKLVVVPRETPLSRLHLDHLSKLAWAGATVLPACPGFYQRPQSIEDLVTQLCSKILGVCGIAQNEVPPWTGTGEA